MKVNAVNATTAQNRQSLVGIQSLRRKGYSPQILAASVHDQALMGYARPIELKFKAIATPAFATIAADYEQNQKYSEALSNIKKNYYYQYYFY